jgi:mannose-6-phosphate isomerase class I
MDTRLNRPYVIIPKLIVQPTWGGTYIIDLKGLGNKPFASKVKIGQSYELFSGTKLFTKADSVSDPAYSIEIGDPDHAETDARYFSLTKRDGYMDLADLIAQDPEGILGSYVYKTYGIMPLLIKINHAKGNSFQLHIKPDRHSDVWKPKAESWYYLENGLLTYGLKKGTSVEKYKQCCIAINDYMTGISRDIMDKKISLEEGKDKATSFIKSQNPWQFVNVIRANKFDLIDLSPGGLHHSWEEDDANPIGNVIYEVQQDVMDPVSTIRSFDQGKIKSDGSIRKLAIDDYFACLDTDETRNDIGSARRSLRGTKALSTRHYSMDVLEVRAPIEDKIQDSFVHLYVREGEVTVLGGNGQVHLTRGTSCFVPATVGSYTIESTTPTSVVLKTYIERS